MRRIWTLLVAAGVVLHAGALHAAGAGALRDGSVTALSVVPASGRTEVVVAVSGEVDVADFMLSKPQRIVLDISGAQLAVAPRMYDKVRRGGIVNIRYSQFRDGVVRVVIELDAQREYEVTRGAGEVRVTLTGESGSAGLWSSAPASSYTAAVTSAFEYDGPVARVAPPAVTRGRTSAAAAARPAVAQQSSQPRITVTYQDADIRDVLAAFAAFSGRTIVVGSKVSGEVTAEIRDQPWDVALQAILSAHGLAAAEDANGIITVDSYANIAAKRATEPLVTQLVSINYARAGSLIETIRALLSKDCLAGPTPGASTTCIVRGTVTADTATNTLIITEVPSRIGDILGYIRDLDIRTPQVAIKAKIILINRTALEEFNLAYDVGTPSSFSNELIQREGSTGDFIVTLGGNTLAGVANASTRIPGAPLRLIFSTMIGNFSLTSFLDAASSLDISDIQAEPTIVTLDNRQAEILVGEETPVRVIDASSGAGGGGTGPRANVQFKETGIILIVTPHITNNRRILMTVHAERSNIELLAASDLGYFFRKERADNQLLVNDGETAVIGGLTRTSVNRSKSGIPFLVDVPLVGRLFGRSVNREVKQDLLILITPHIIDDGEETDRSPGS